ncbi:hypothetical protein PEC18_26100 [Paucibacter sp. O1-1]|nr:hypothetical protein [Paucibacter sp. O1-1]MDA3829213.1 hypothetical protein [Paucibacter sp. O1-1]
MNSHSEFYAIRVLIKHPSWTVAEITARLSEEPDYSWSVGERGKTETMWSSESYTRGQRFFFDEVRNVLEWIQSRDGFARELNISGGSLSVIVNLPGVVNLGCTLEPETMQLAVLLGASVGVEVFPNMRHPDAQSSET